MPCRGHASENPELPEALAQLDIRFLGPSAAAMGALGDKASSAMLALSDADASNQRSWMQMHRICAPGCRCIEYALLDADALNLRSWIQTHRILLCVQQE